MNCENNVGIGNSYAAFSNNCAKSKGGALLFYNSNYKTKGNSTVTFHGNNAKYGGAVFCISNIVFKHQISMTTVLV